MMIGNVIQEILCWLVSVKETHAQYWNDNYVFVIMYVACLVIMISMRDKAPNGHKLLSAYSLLLIGLILYNPVAHYIGFNLFKESESIRIWLLLPVVTVIAFAITVVTDNPSLKKTGKGAVIGALAAVIFFFGSSIMRTQMMVDTTNVMKINDESVRIAEIVLNDNNNTPTSLLVFTMEDYTYDQFVSGGTVSEGIKQYTGIIDVSRVSVSRQYWEDNYVADISPTGVYGVSYVPMAMEIYHHTIDYEYIAMPASDAVIVKMNAAGFNLVGSTDNYYVYKANSDWEIISLDFTYDDGPDLFVARDRVGHYVFITTSATQDIEQVLNYIRSTTIEIDAWIVCDSSSETIVGELIENVQIDRIYLCEDDGLTVDNNQIGNTIELYGLDIVIGNGDIILCGNSDEYKIVSGQTTEDVAKVVLK